LGERIILFSTLIINDNRFKFLRPIHSFILKTHFMHITVIITIIIIYNVLIHLLSLLIILGLTEVCQIYSILKWGLYCYSVIMLGSGFIFFLFKTWNAKTKFCCLLVIKTTILFILIVFFVLIKFMLFVIFVKKLFIFDLIRFH